MASVVVHFHRGESFANTLNDIANLPLAEVVVVDNGSVGSVTEEMVSVRGFSYLRAATNLGYGAGMNVGFMAVKTSPQFILFLTHEVAIDRDALEAMVDTALSTGAAIVGPQLRSSRTSMVWSAGGLIGPGGKVSHRKESTSGDTRVDWVDGAVLLVRREVFESLDGFDQDFFLYFEDVDLALRAEPLGGVWVSGAAQCSQDTNLTPPFYRARNSILLWRKHRQSIWLLRAAGGTLLLGLRARSQDSPVATARESLRGLWSGLTSARTDSRWVRRLRRGRAGLAILNPIPDALRHYQDALLATLASTDVACRVLAARSIENERWSRGARLRRALSIVRERRSGGGLEADESLLILWPAFGYFDILTWRRTAKQRTVWLVVHDPRPLSRTFGYGHFARWVAGVALYRQDLRVIVHSREAQLDLPSGFRARAWLAPLPIEPPAPGLLRPHQTRQSDTASVRVLGRCKAERDMRALADIAAECGDLRLEISGPGWPQVPGWHVDSRFVEENEFHQLLSTASCVVIPYERFYQSDVLVRCLEHGTPVVVPRQTQTLELFGDGYPGLVKPGESWARAVRNVAAVDPGYFLAILATAREQAVTAWSSILASSAVPAGGLIK